MRRISRNKRGTDIVKGDCPPQTQYCIATFDVPDETYESLMYHRRKGKTFDEWWTISTLGGVS